jgi:hypothetical protein
MERKFLVLGLLLAVATGCSKKDKGGICEDYVDLLRSCDLITSGRVGCPDLEYDDQTRCEADCIFASTCDDLGPFVCTGSFTPSLGGCFDVCLETHGFACADGSGTVHESWRCDMEDDCPDGSDEEGCTYFSCRDGSGDVPQGYVCDCFLDCPDGSDEDGCPYCPTFTCANGEVILDSWVCDFYEDCTDGSDEVGCATFNCP